MRRLVATLLAGCLTLCLLAPAALAGDEGEGLYGETNDQVVTGAGFVLILFFPLFVAVMSFLQSRLDRRKHARMDAEQARRARAGLRGGW